VQKGGQVMISMGRVQHYSIWEQSQSVYFLDEVGGHNSISIVVDLTP
jgi:hypothetical protein